MSVGEKGREDLDGRKKSVRPSKVQGAEKANA